ncbi:hypothetical protein ACTUV2_17795 [Acinetobacter baumannii]|uniref:hypothetical protein n=2 Tax=Acinetobacter baumannii TaxID=470 RepID=UPI0022EAFDC6|nr:hypothetical protein [Acinetobacter baumannii]MDA3562064.1 hypothetical protein [Acinetobacter baumannii]
MNLNNLPINAQMHALRHSITDYEDWTRTLYNDIDEVFSSFLDNTEVFLSLSEPQISSMIGVALRMRYYNVQVDSDKNGNADLSVQLNSFLWIGEAKIVNNNTKTDFEYLHSGLTQLLTRYSKGQGNATNGALLIYIKPNSRFTNEHNFMNEWIEFMKIHEPSYQSHFICPQKSTCLKSHHTHPTSGHDYSVRHMPMTLFHIPEDSSGKGAQKYAERRSAYESASIGPSKEEPVNYFV